VESLQASPAATPDKSLHLFDKKRRVKMEEKFFWALMGINVAALIIVVTMMFF